MWPQKSCVPEGPLPVLAVPAMVTCPCLTPMWRVMVSAIPGCGERYWVWRTWDLLATWMGELRWPHRARQSPSPELIPLFPLACPECLPQAPSRESFKSLNRTFLSTKERLYEPRVLLPLWPMWQREFLNFSKQRRSVRQEQHLSFMQLGSGHAVFYWVLISQNDRGILETSSLRFSMKNDDQSFRQQ